ncbi:uncharacterized protein [Rutidosis leptorrhynchoides]|uniref:uncharacterized protein n=1 Tax=Rutidosis leptorrhynchoides TaxID=125765 RepID=UPI003A99A6A3
MGSFMEEMKKTLEIQNKSIAALGKQIGQVAEENATRESNTTPSYTLLNPNHESQGRGHEVNMVGTLRSGKTYDNKVKMPKKSEIKYGLGKSPVLNDLCNDDNEVSVDFGVGLNVEKPVVEKFEETDMETNTIPFPKALESPNQSPYGKKGQKIDDMWETFKQVKLTEKVSAVISGSLTPKLKDLRTPLISVTVGNVNVKKALLDFGASINILPSSFVDWYELGTLKRTDIIIQLTDRSMRTPRGMLENVIVKVEDFYYPVDFIVMDTETTFRDIQPTIILGRPFLATIDSLINCRTGVIDISFGNKRSRINIFNSLHTPNVQDCFVLDTNHEQVQKYAPDVKEKEDVRKFSEEGMTSEFMESHIRTNAEILMSQQESIQNLERELKNLSQIPETKLSSSITTTCSLLVKETVMAVSIFVGVDEKVSKCEDDEQLVTPKTIEHVSSDNKMANEGTRSYTL